MNRILGEAGYKAIEMEPVALSFDIAIGRGLERGGAGRVADRAGKPGAGRASAGDSRRGREIREGNPDAIRSWRQRAAGRINLDRDGARLLRALRPFFPDRGEMDDGLHRLFHVLTADPFQAGVESVLAGKDVGAGQSHEREP